MIARVGGMAVSGALAMLLAGCVAPQLELDAARQHQQLPQRMAAVAGTPLDTYWKLVEMDGAPAPTGSGGKELHLLLQPDKPIARGFSGCNRFTGDYTLEGDRLSFGPLASTRMACAEGMDAETRFLTLLGEVAGWTREGDVLSLTGAGGQVLARFEARHL